MINNQIIEKSANTIRGLTLDAVGKANSGHVGVALGCADIVSILYSKILKHNPENPEWIDRDRFVLSAGHGSMLLYSILHLSGYDISIEDIKQFRQLNSKTPGHPEYRDTPGVEVTTGPLGQGVSNAVGMAIAEKMLAEKFNIENFNIIDHYTYCLAGDGCLMEGISSEASSLAGHLGLGKLILIYDDNKITIDGTTDISFSENVAKRYESYNWHIQEIDGYDYDAIVDVIQNAKSETEKPSIIITKTIPGKGLVNYEGSYKSHGCPMNSDDIEKSKVNLGLQGSFIVPDEVKEYFSESIKQLKKTYSEWNNQYKEYESKFPDMFKELNKSLIAKEEICNNNYLDDSILKSIASRSSSGKILNKISKDINFIIGGSADLAGSNNTTIEDDKFIENGNFKGRNIHFGIREHALGGILNGIALHKGFRVFGGTFLVFSDYLRPSIRLASLMKLPVIYIFTHDSFQVGEDGPTHQPIEHIQSLRNIPNLIVLRPSDTYEVEAAWKYSLSNKNNPIALILSRQNINLIDRKKFKSADGLYKGAYIIKDTENNPDLIIISTGAELVLSIEVSEIIEKKYKKNVRVVSMPSQEIFDLQKKNYKNAVLPENIKDIVSIEFGITNGWVKYTGRNGLNIGIDTFGNSAPAKKLIDYYNFTSEKISNQIKNHFNY